MKRLDYKDIHGQNKGRSSEIQLSTGLSRYKRPCPMISGKETNTDFNRNSQVDISGSSRAGTDTDPSQSLSQRYDAGDFFESSDDQNDQTDSGSDFYLPGKSKKKHRIHFKDVKGLLTCTKIFIDVTSGVSLDRKCIGRNNMIEVIR